MARRRFPLAALMALIAMNVWIGGPLLALWIGSRVQSSTGSSLTIRPITALTVFGSLTLITVALVRALRLVSQAYDRAAGVSPGTRRHDSWVSIERRSVPGEPVTLSTLERILVVVVVCAALAFEIWFFFYSTSPIDQRSGRGAVPLAGQVRRPCSSAGEGQALHGGHPHAQARPPSARDRQLRRGQPRRAAVRAAATDATPVRPPAASCVARPESSA